MNANHLMTGVLFQLLLIDSLILDVTPASMYLYCSIRNRNALVITMCFMLKSFAALLCKYESDNAVDNILHTHTLYKS
jgi:hypothetical protein